MEDHKTARGWVKESWVRLGFTLESNPGAEVDKTANDEFG